MLAPRRILCRLACAGLLGAGALLAPGAPAAPATAATPISLFALPSVDGQGIVLTWSLTLLTLNAPSFQLSRRNAADVGDPGLVIDTAGNVDRGYTDYGLSVAGTYCYTLTAVVPGATGLTSPEVCAGFMPGVAGPGQPMFGAGCSRFYELLPAGAATGAIAAHFTPFNAVVSLWRFDPNAGQLSAGFFAKSGTPVDYTQQPSAPEFDYVCLNQPATYH